MTRTQSQAAPTYSATRVSSKAPRITITRAMNAMVSMEAAGHHGDGNSDAGRDLRAISRFMATWEARIMAQTQTVAKVAIEAISRKTSSGITAFSTTPTSRMPVIITTVIHGTP